jgi:hypothetical protein
VAHYEGENVIQHHANCRAGYPEKPAGEPPKHVVREDLGDGYWVATCSDCGAFETNLPPEDDPYWDDVRDHQLDENKRS